MVNRILQHWNALILVFQDAVLGENLRSVENLQNIIYKVYFNFLSYILELVNKLTIEFQSEHCKISCLGERIRSLYRTILKNFVKNEYLDNIAIEDIDPKNPRNFLSKT